MWSLSQRGACFPRLCRSSPTPKAPWAWAAPSLKTVWALSAACHRATSLCTSTTPRSPTPDATSVRLSSLTSPTSPPSSTSTWRVEGPQPPWVWSRRASSNGMLLSSVPPAPPQCSLLGKPALKGNVTLSCTSSYGTPVPMYNWKRASPTSEVFFPPSLSKNSIAVASGHLKQSHTRRRWVQKRPLWPLSPWFSLSCLTLLLLYSTDSQKVERQLVPMIFQWKCLGEVAVDFLIRLFNKILETNKMPNEWRKSVLVPIYKKGFEPCLVCWWMDGWMDYTANSRPLITRFFFFLFVQMRKQEVWSWATWATAWREPTCAQPATQLDPRTAPSSWTSSPVRPSIACNISTRK